MAAERRRRGTLGPAAAGLAVVPYDVSFAFSAFVPDGALHHE